MSRSTIVVAAGSAAAGVSIMACMVTIAVLISFKIYREFTYRLYLYTLIVLTLFSITEILHLTLLYKDGNCEFLFVGYMYSFFFYVSLSLMSSCIFYLHKLAMYYQPHSKFIYDLNYCMVSLILPTLSSVSFKFVCENGDDIDGFDSTNTSPIISCTHMTKYMLITSVLMMVVIFFNGIFITCVIGSLCLKACAGCIATTLTKDHYLQALKETMPLLILPVVTQMYAYYACTTHYVVPIFKLEIFGLAIQLVSAVLAGLIGFVASLSFGLHLCILGKRKLRKLRGHISKPSAAAAGYGTMNQQHTHRTTGYTAAGILETCNTTFPQVSEDDVDREILMGQRMRH